MKLAELVKNMQEKQLSQDEKLDLLGQIIMQQQLQITEMQQKINELAGGTSA